MSKYRGYWLWYLSSYWALLCIRATENSYVEECTIKSEPNYYNRKNKNSMDEKMETKWLNFFNDIPLFCTTLV